MRPVEDEAENDDELSDSEFEDLLQRKQELERQLQLCGLNPMHKDNDNTNSWRQNGETEPTNGYDEDVHEPESKRIRPNDDLPTTPMKDGHPTSSVSFELEANTSFNYFSTPDQAHSDWEIPNTPAKCPIAHTSPDKSLSNGENNVPMIDDFDPVHLLEKAVDEEESARMTLKYVPLYRRKDIVEPLPTGWREITHASGVSVYLHATSRVCTFSRPYYLGKGSVRHHEVPLCAIPCFHERKVNELVDKKKEEAQKAGSALPLGDIEVPKQGEDFGLNSQLTSASLREYAKPVFRFKTLKIKRNFSRWRDRADHSKEQKEMENQRLIDAIEDGGDDAERVRRCVLPDSVVMAAPQGLARGGKPGRSRAIVVAGKTAVNILHDYASKMMKGAKIEYVEDQGTRSAAAPYQMSVYVKFTAEGRLAVADNIKEKLAVLREREKFQNGEDNGERGQLLGRGVGASKKEAKRLAAQEAVKLLLNAAIRFSADGEAILENEEAKYQIIEQEAETLFDDVALDDPKVAQLAPRAAVPSPLELLKIKLQKTASLATMNLEWKHVEKIGQRVRVHLKLGDFEVAQEADRRQSAEQLCAQKALKHLHKDTEITSYGALLKIYAQDLRQQYEGIREQKAVTKLQSTQKLTGNNAVVAKLCAELKKLEETTQRRNRSICSTEPPISA